MFYSTLSLFHSRSLGRRLPRVISEGLNYDPTDRPFLCENDLATIELERFLFFLMILCTIFTSNSIKTEVDHHAT